MNTGLISPLVQYLEGSGLIKPFAGFEGVKSKAVVLDWPSGTTNNDALYFFSDSSLDGANCTITEIEVVDQTTQPVSLYTNPAKDNLSDTQLANGWLVLSDEGQNEICMLPLNGLVRRLNNGKPTFLNVDTQIWQNCYVMFSDSTILTTSNCLTLRVSYVEKGDKLED
jgi:hypothetical protein